MSTDNSIFLSTVTLANRELSAIKEVTGATYETTYLAFGAKGVTALTESKFAVQRIQKTIATGVTTFMWANGKQLRELPFNSPETLTYYYSK